MLVAVAQHNLASEWRVGEQFGEGQEGSHWGQQRCEVVTEQTVPQQRCSKSLGQQTMRCGTAPHHPLMPPPHLRALCPCGLDCCKELAAWGGAHHRSLGRNTGALAAGHA